MPTRILKAILAILVVVVAGAAPQRRAPLHFSTSGERVDSANVVLAETSSSSPSFQALASHPAANPLNVTGGPTFSEPFLLLLTGTLLIGVGTSIRRLTTSRRQSRPAVPRQT